MRTRPYRPLLSLPVLAIGLLLAAQALMPAARLWHELTCHIAAAEHDHQTPGHHDDDDSTCGTCQAIALARLADFTLPLAFVEFLTLRPESVFTIPVSSPAQAPRLWTHAPRGPPSNV